MNDINYKMSLLLGKPIFTDEIGYVYSPTLNEIESIGMYGYLHYLSIIINKPDQFQSYEVYYGELIRHKESQQFLTNAICFFTKNDFVFSSDLKSFISSNYYNKNGSIIYFRINKDNFLSFVNSVRLVNSLKVEQEVKYSGDKAKQMAEKFKKLREKYEKAFKKDDDLDYTDIISTVASRHPSVNLSNIGEITLYQLMDKFRRLHNIDEYNINIQALMNGAKDIKLEHYSKRFDSN